MNCYNLQLMLSLGVWACPGSLAARTVQEQVAGAHESYSARIELRLIRALILCVAILADLLLHGCRVARPQASGISSPASPPLQPIEDPLSDFRRSQSLPEGRVRTPEVGCGGFRLPSAAAAPSGFEAPTSPLT